MRTNVLHLRRVADPRPLPAVSERPDGTLVVDVPTVLSDEWLRRLAELLTTSTGPAAPGSAGPAVARPELTPRAGILVVGALRMDLDRMQASLAHQPLTFTRQEFLLLKAFLQHPGRVFTRGQLRRIAWNHDEWDPGRTVDVHVRRLRVKLGDEAVRLVTVRGFGYRFDTADAGGEALTATG